jgi:hypothetical protein
VIRPLGPGRAELPLEARWCSGDVLFGGALLAGLVSASTAAAELPLLSVTAQFVARARRPGCVELSVERLGTSRSLAPVHVTAVQDDALVATAAAVHVAEIPAGRPARTRAPAVRRPEDCPSRPYQHPRPGSITDELDVRLAGLPDGDAGAGGGGAGGAGAGGGAGLGCRLWARWPAAGPGRMSAAVLALLSDHIPFAPWVVMGEQWYGTTLDATLRVLPGIDHVAADAWVLLDIAFDLLGDLAHGTVWLWAAPSGPAVGPPVPLAIGTQALRIRKW